MVNFSKLLEGYYFESRVSSVKPNDYIFKFKNQDQEYLFVYWTTELNHTVTIPQSTGKGEIINLYGSSERIKWKNNEINLEVAPSPRYLIISE